MDVCILAGGLGTRLAGVWSGPKCLVPVGGVVLLERLLYKVLAEAAPNNVVISLGYQALEVIEWWLRRNPPIRNSMNIRFAVEPAPIGRMRALASCLPALNFPALVLNGDTLPQYSFRLLGADPCIAVLRSKPSVAAGAVVINEEHASIVEHYYRLQPTGLEEVLFHFIDRKVHVPGFLDVGTPEGFAAAQQLDAAEG